jgi:predicted DCC family thiol-disulfide oxidoreductase YuxK
MIEDRNIIIFDGICNFCNGAINFILKRDKNELYKFAPMQSEAGKMLIKKYNAQLDGIETFLLIKSSKTYIKTEAAFEVIKDLPGGWKYLRILRVIPLSIRDWMYTKFAMNRYKLFGKRTACIIPTKETRNRFLS